MPASTNPKKKSLMPSSPLRRSLRAAGHHLSPVVQVGKEGLTDAVVRQLDDALLHHELVKVKVGTESPEDRFEVADALGERTGAQVAQVLGRTVLAYRKHPEKPKFEAGPPAPRGGKPARGAKKLAGGARKSAGGAKKPARAAGRPDARRKAPADRQRPAARKRPAPRAR